MESVLHQRPLAAPVLPMHDAASLDLFSDPSFLVQSSAEVRDGGGGPGNITSSKKKNMDQQVGRSDKSYTSFSSHPDDVSFSSLSRDTGSRMSRDASRDKSLSSHSASLGMASFEKSFRGGEKDTAAASGGGEGGWSDYRAEEAEEGSLKPNAPQDAAFSPFNTSDRRKQFEAAQHMADFNDSCMSLPVDFGSGNDFFGSPSNVGPLKKGARATSTGGGRRNRSATQQQIQTPIGAVLLSPKIGPSTRQRRSSALSSGTMSPKIQARLMKRPTATNFAGAVVNQQPPPPPLDHSRTNSPRQRRMPLSVGAKQNTGSPRLSQHVQHISSGNNLSPKSAPASSVTNHIHRRNKKTGLSASAHGSSSTRNRGPSLAAKIELNRKLQSGGGAASLDGGISALDPRANIADSGNNKFQNSWAISEMSESMVGSEQEAFDFSDDDFEQADKHKFDENDESESSNNDAVGAAAAAASGGGGAGGGAWGALVNSFHTPKTSSRTRNQQAQKDAFPTAPPFGGDDDANGGGDFAQEAFEADPFADTDGSAKPFSMSEFKKSFHEKEHEMVAKLQAKIQELETKMKNNNKLSTTLGAIGQTGEMDLKSGDGSGLFYKSDDTSTVVSSATLKEVQENFQKKEEQLTQELTEKDKKIKDLERELAHASAHARTIDYFGDSLFDDPVDEPLDDGSFGNSSDKAKKGDKPKRRGSTGAMAERKNAKAKLLAKGGGGRAGKTAEGGKKKRNSTGGLKDKAKEKRKEGAEEKAQEEEGEPADAAVFDGPLGGTKPKAGKMKRSGSEGKLEDKGKSGKPKRRGSTGAVQARRTAKREEMKNKEKAAAKGVEEKVANVKEDKDMELKTPTKDGKERQGRIETDDHDAVFGTMELAGDGTKPKKTRNRSKERSKGGGKRGSSIGSVSSKKSEKKTKKKIAAEGGEETAVKEANISSPKLKAPKRRQSDASNPESVSSKSSKKSPKKKAGKALLKQRSSKSLKNDDEGSVKSTKSAKRKGGKKNGVPPPPPLGSPFSLQSPSKKDDSSISSKSSKKKSKKGADDSESVGGESIKRKKKFGGFKKWLSPMDFGSSSPQAKTKKDGSDHDSKKTKKKKGLGTKSSGSSVGTETSKSSSPTSPIQITRVRKDGSNANADTPLEDHLKKGKQSDSKRAVKKKSTTSEDAGNEDQGTERELSLSPSLKRPSRKHSIHGVPTEVLNQLAMGASVRDLVNELDGEEDDLANGPNDVSILLTPKTESRRKVITGALKEKFEFQSPRKSKKGQDRWDVGGDDQGLGAIQRAARMTPRTVAKSKVSTGPLRAASAEAEEKLDGTPLSYWDKSNFDFKRDSMNREVCEPKQGDAFYKEHLNSVDYGLLREHGIEQPYLSAYNRVFPTSGQFCCKACGNSLYEASAKIDAANGWPCFESCIAGSVETGHIAEWGNATTEIHCYRCKSHVGNITKEEDDKKSKDIVERHRVNGRSLKYVKTNPEKAKSSK